MQFYIEEYVEKNLDIEQLARRAFLSYVRAYSTYPRELKHIFHPKNLHIGHLAKSFGLRKSPNEIVDNEINIKRSTRDSNMTNFKRNKPTSEFQSQTKR
jgi:ATP-dependent RNA helicase DDX31/DBP7